MKIIMFYHSLRSDWNHGNAHFLRGVASELLSRGNDVIVYEPENNWSFTNLVQQHGVHAGEEYREYYPLLKSRSYSLGSGSLDPMLDGADLVIVHEWNDHDLVKQLGEKRKESKSFCLLFHDTHHRTVSDRSAMSRYDFSNYDGVLAYGRVIRDIYIENGWAARAWVWHEAADINIFHPYDNIKKESDAVWVGNWGDDERTAEIYEYFLKPSSALKIKTSAYGVRYPDYIIAELERAGITYHGWLPNYKVPHVFAKHRFTVHIPRRPYAEQLPGIPTIRPFEALACGIPLISAPWNDSEGLFRQGTDYLTAGNSRQMKEMINAVLNDGTLAESLSRNGLETILKYHTCSHRTDELLSIAEELGGKKRRRTDQINIKQ